MKRLLILGATGGTGLHLVSQALEAGNEVTAYVRDLAKLEVKHERLRVVVGPIADEATAFREAMRGQEAVISTLGRGLSLQSEHVIERCVPPMLSAMKAHGVGRLVFTSAIGVGEAYSEAPLLSKLVIRMLLKHIYPDKLIGENLVRNSDLEWTIVQPAGLTNGQLTLVRNSDLEWTIVQPAGLTNGQLTRRYRAAEHLRHRTIATISRADLAHFLLSQVDDRTYVRRIAQLEY
jgi:putative NADH-flavin reductase